MILIQPDSPPTGEEDVIWNPKPLRQRGDLRTFLKRQGLFERGADEVSLELQFYFASQVEALKSLAESLTRRRENLVLGNWLFERADRLEKQNLITRQMVQNIFSRDESQRGLRSDSFSSVHEVRTAWEAVWQESQRIISQLRVLRDLQGLRGIQVPFVQALGAGSEISAALANSFRELKISAVHGDGAQWTMFIWADVPTWRKSTLKAVAALAAARRSRRGGSLPHLSVAVLGKDRLGAEELKQLARDGVTVLEGLVETN